MTDESEKTIHHVAHDLCVQAVNIANGMTGPLKRVRLHSGDVDVEIEWSETHRTDSSVSGTSGEDRANQKVNSQEEDKGILITSPLVGTFYRSPDPQSSPFVDVGDLVFPGQQIAIVEAMKLMNPVEVEVNARVSEVIVSDGDPVEYGAPLFRMELL